ncbi:capsular polysaccharide biosynthesis protein [Jeotgalibacillus malaysiensis]|uniref:Capsular polysaccharide biosynthesis protein n=1 Tax=Jeotgalibacillus malaysiensis TaxID=1508404 RepID=A0A0B5AQ91_9BACL|nr:Wzz/FepE/Etk N-terminal domain-containing protein [Jeotgalibacillus malaysiensis]AJD92266.1 capsular polysaccharide biosynthesis protein [Jeotgalibacillus malaysiensis]
MEETISLKELFGTLKKRLMMILSIALLAVVVASIISFFVITPMYQSTTQLLVNQEQTEPANVQVSDIQANLQLINTYSGIIKSPAILEPVSEQLNNELSVGQLNSKITVQNEQNSQIVNLTVEDENPYKAAEIANMTAEVFQNEIVDLMNVNNVNILSPAVVTDNQSPVSPQPFLNMAIALVVGLMVGVGIAFLLEYLDNSIKTEQDIEQHLELPILGVIGSMDNKQTVSTSKVNVQQNRARSERYGS